SPRRSRADSSSVGEPLQTASTAKAAHVRFGGGELRTVFTKPNESLKRAPPLDGPVHVSFADSLAHQLRNRRARLPGADLQRLPDVFLKVELSTLHDVYYTSRFLHHVDCNLRCHVPM